MKRTELKVFRTRLGLTQAQMAERLGISQSHYVGIELGVQNPSYGVIERFCDEFGSENIELLTRKG